MSKTTFEELMQPPAPPGIAQECVARSYLREGFYGKRRPDGLCIVCREPMPPRRMRYCSDKCAHWFTENHDWTTARHAAWRTNSKINFIVVVSHSSYTLKDDTIKEFDTSREYACCSRCKEPEQTYGSDDYYKSRLEVDHIIPINGGNRAKTCLNHQENLRVLCHRCHLEATKEQRKAGLIGRKK